MLRVTVEVIPNGDESKKRPIRVMMISDLTSLADLGDYEVHVVGESHASKKYGRIRGGVKNKLGCWALVARAIRALKLDLER